MKDNNMTTTRKFSTRLSRRVFLGAMGVSVGFSGLPFNLRAAPKSTGRAIAFDSDALILADRTLSRNDGGWTPLPVPTPGDILSLSTHPGRPGRILAGLTSGGVALSEDGGC
jgi:hypothetical protein